MPVLTYCYIIKKQIKNVHPLTCMFIMISLISNFKLLNIAGHKLMTFK